MAKGLQPVGPSDSRDRSSNFIISASSETESLNNNRREQMNMNSRRSRLNLPLNHMAIPVYTVSKEEVEVGGRMLFQNFVHEQFQYENVSEDVLQAGDQPFESFPSVRSRNNDPLAVNRPVSPAYAGTPEGFKTMDFIKVGSDLRAIANQFAQSRERPLVRQQADQVDFGQMTREAFFNMLTEYFRDGVTKYGIVALFYFCSDVLMRCAKESRNSLGTQLFLWSLEFIVDSVCQWVYDYGGWDKLFSDIYKVLFKVAAVSALFVVIGCGILYLKKNW